MSKIIGIDLGTSDSCVAVLENGKPVVIAGAAGSETVPSAVSFAHGGERLSGRAAKRRAVTDADRTVLSVRSYPTGLATAAQLVSRNSLNKISRAYGKSARA